MAPEAFDTPVQPLASRRSLSVDMDRSTSLGSIDQESLGPVTSFNPPAGNDSTASVPVSPALSQASAPQQPPQRLSRTVSRTAAAWPPVDSSSHGSSSSGTLGKPPRQERGWEVGAGGPQPPRSQQWASAAQHGQRTAASPATRTPTLRAPRDGAFRSGWHSSPSALTRAQLLAAGSSTAHSAPLGRASTDSTQPGSPATVRSEDKAPAPPVRAGLVRATVEKFKHAMPPCAACPPPAGRPHGRAHGVAGSSIAQAPPAGGTAEAGAETSVGRSRVAQTVSKFASRMHCTGADGAGLSAAMCECWLMCMFEDCFFPGHSRQ